MIFNWILSMLGWNQEAHPATSVISDDYILVPAPILKKPIPLNLTKKMSIFQQTTAPQAPTNKPFTRRPILNESNREFFDKLAKILSKPPVNQIAPTRPDAEAPKPKQKNYDHLKPLHAPVDSRTTFSQVLLQIRARKGLPDEQDAVLSETITVETQHASHFMTSDAFINKRIALTKELCQLKTDHFKEPSDTAHDSLRDETIVLGDAAPIAPPLTTIVEGTFAPMAPALR